MTEEIPESIRRKYSPARRKAIVQALADGNTLAASASAGGITSVTLWRWRQALPEFDEECRDAEYAYERRAMKFLDDQMVSGNLSAVLFWLERRRKEDWGRRDYTLDTAPARITVIEAVAPTLPASTDAPGIGPGDQPSTIEGEYSDADEPPF